MSTTAILFIGITGGFIVGAWVGMIIMAVCSAAGREDERMGRK